MAYDLKKEGEVKDYLENLGIEYRFGCYKEKKPEVCHLLGDYLEAIKKDFEKAAKVYKNNCEEYKFGKSCLKFGNYTLVGKGKTTPDPAGALPYFEKGCELEEPTACLHAGLLYTATGAGVPITRDVPKGHNYIKKSCDSNVEMACHFLSGMYMSGIPRDPTQLNPHNLKENEKIEYLLKPDMKQAFTYARKACGLGNMYACANVSTMYKKGEGVEQNEEESKRYFKLAQELQKARETTKELKFQQGLDDKK